MIVPAKPSLDAPATPSPAKVEGVNTRSMAQRESSPINPASPMSDNPSTPEHSPRTQLLEAIEDA